MTDERWYGCHLNIRSLKSWGFSLILVIMFMNACKAFQPFNEPAGASQAQLMINDQPDSPEHDSFLISEFYRSQGIHVPILFRLPTAFSEVKQQAILSAVQTWEMVTGQDLFLRVNDQSLRTNPPWRTPMPYEFIKRGVSKQDCAVLVEAAYDGVTDFFFISQWKSLFENCKHLERLAQAGAFTFPALLSYADHHSDQPVTYISGDIYFNSERYCFRDIKADDCDQHRVEAVMGYVLAYNISLERVVLHELGHVLGLDHVVHLRDIFSIMRPGAGVYVSGVDEILEMDAMLSPGDIARIQSLYGCQGKACDSRAAHAMQQKSQRHGPPPAQF